MKNPYYTAYLVNLIPGAVVVAFILIIVIYFLIKLAKKNKAKQDIILANTEVVAKILSQEVKKSFFDSKIYVEGFYKGRKICYRWERDRSYVWDLRASITPSSFQRPNKWIVLRTPQPTKFTATEGKEVYSSDVAIFLAMLGEEKLIELRNSNKNLSFNDLAGSRINTREEVINLLEELTKAAEIVEQGAPYFAE